LLPAQHGAGTGPGRHPKAAVGANGRRLLRGDREPELLCGGAEACFGAIPTPEGGFRFTGTRSEGACKPAQVPPGCGTGPPGRGEARV